MMRSRPGCASVPADADGMTIMMRMACDVSANTYDAACPWLPDTPHTRSAVLRAAMVPSQMEGCISPEGVTRLRQLAADRWLPQAALHDRDAIMAIPYSNDFSWNGIYSEKRMALVARPWMSLLHTPYRDELAAVCLSLTVAEGRATDVDMDILVRDDSVLVEPWDAGRRAYSYRVAIARHVLAELGPSV